MGKFDDLPEVRRQGLEKMEQVYGFEMNDTDGDFLRYTAEHLFGDPAILRRDMVGQDMLSRTDDGSVYRRNERRPPAEALALIRAVSRR